MDQVRYTWKTYLLCYGSAAAFLLLFLQPVLHAEYFGDPLRSSFLRVCFRAGMLALPILVGWACSRSLPTRGERRMVPLFSIAIAGLCEIIHFHVVDRAHFFPVSMFRDNTAWQIWMHAGIVHLDAGYLPHSYRFLPDSIVEMLRWGSNSFELSRIVFRLTANVALFAFTYRIGRFYLTQASAIAVMLLVALVYPVSILRYAGQLVDPLSHLSMVLCFYAARSGCEPGFGPSLFVGLLAKESAIVMVGCRVFTGPNRVRSLLWAALYALISLAIIVSIRLIVNGGTLRYGSVSGVEPRHLIDNLRSYGHWIPLYVFTIGVFAPGALLGWRYVDTALRASTVIVLAGLVVSSALFSWLSETRNLLPAAILMAIMTMRYVEVRLAASPPAWSDKAG